MTIAKTPEQCALSLIRARRLRIFLPLSEEIITCIEEDVEHDLQFLSQQELEDYTDWTPDGDPQNDFVD
jgi:hypothetical protein